MHLGLILSTCVVVLLISWMHLRHRERVKKNRASMFEACKHVFGDAEIVQDDVNFPVLTGHYRNYPVKLTPIADHVGFRKLPSLWLLITIKAERPSSGIFDFLVRPQNIEFFSPCDQLEHQVSIPAHWPQYALLKTDNPERMPSTDELDKHMSLFDDNKVKELVLTPRGVRIVYQANQAEQSNYRTLRSLSFHDLSVTPELITELLDKAITIHEDLTEKSTHENSARYVHGTEQLKAAS